MANYLRTRLHFLIGLTGFLVFCFGIFILASGIKIRNILTGELKSWFASFGFGSNTCQFWAGIPVRLRTRSNDIIILLGTLLYDVLYSNYILLLWLFHGVARASYAIEYCFIIILKCAVNILYF